MVLSIIRTAPRPLLSPRLTATASTPLVSRIAASHQVALVRNLTTSIRCRRAHNQFGSPFEAENTKPDDSFIPSEAPFSATNTSSSQRDSSPPWPSSKDPSSTSLSGSGNDKDVNSNSKSNLRAPRNPLGVQLLSPRLSAQVFPSTSDPPPPLHPHAVSLSQAHLSSHGLSPSQASELAESSFQLPPLQGRDLGEHFWNIGREASQPWLNLSERLAATLLPSPPEGMVEPDHRLPDFDQYGRPSPLHWTTLDASVRQDVEPIQSSWLRKSGWVRYPLLKSEDGQSTVVGEGEPVAYPDPHDSALVFDVETMVTAGPWPVMAAAAGGHAWYAWLSPWLLGESERKDHLIPFGSSPSAPERLLVGHNVSYDRARILDEYTMDQSKIRFLDTQSLHVAVRGISSPQRPAWIQYRKNRAQKAARKLLEDEQIKQEQKDELRRLLGGDEIDETQLGHLADIGVDLEALTNVIDTSMLPTLPRDDGDISDEDGPSNGKLQWQDISSTNSLAAVASLYCDIELPKDLRNEFVEATSRQEILDRLPELMDYCARDVAVTQQVFAQVLPSFRERCPHPATFAGVLGIGSPILPVDDEWIQYQKRCHDKYEAALVGVQEALIKLAESLRSEYASTAEEQWWSNDPWLSQLDWSPKQERKAKLPIDDQTVLVPKWYKAYVQSKKPPTPAQITSAHILLLTLNGAPISKVDGTWKAGDLSLPSAPTSRTFLSTRLGKNVQSGLGQIGTDILDAIRNKEDKAIISERLLSAAEELYQRAQKEPALKARFADLNWDQVVPAGPDDATSEPLQTWPRWYWDLFKPTLGKIELTIRTKIAPLLLKISWQGCPLYHSREHGWVFLHRPLQQPEVTTRQKPMVFNHEADEQLRKMSERHDDNPHLFYKVPHSSGDDANVGSPFSKSFQSYFDDGVMRSEHPDELGKKVAKDALDLNAQCSYWIGVRDRVANQMVVWDGESESNMGFLHGASGMGSGPDEENRRKGLILPQIVAMGTITRRAIEKTWLTASNAKKNRVGSELKAMVKAPPGWSIVGADVDSEELWICSVMGDAQFGLHGATAIGWMTLEGTKAAGTDLHSKTASILGTSRNQAKIFNYSRIYGAGIRHATQLMVKANPSMPREEAQQRAKDLYSKTKGQNTHSTECFDRRFWFGGTESFVFNKLEEVALSENPRTPALDCGITAALSKQFLPKAQYSNGRAGEDFMPSRINWVVQSSGVDYLHLLITSMNHLCKHYDIAARFMISVHDEVRYLAKDGDRHRAALALQIANLWTRAMFAFKLQMEDLPEGVAWFAAVDVDRVLRKEVDDPCITPSHPDPIAAGKAYEIADTLKETNGGSLHADGRAMDGVKVVDLKTDEYPPYQPSDQSHRSFGERGVLFLQAQTSGDIHEIRALERRAKSLEAHGQDVERPNGAEWEDMNGDRGTPQRKQAAISRSKHSATVRKPRSAQKSSPAVGSRSFATSARSNTSRARTEAAVPDSMKEILTAFPVKANLFRQTIFWTTSQHKKHVKWGLYRATLRLCPDEGQCYKQNIRNRFRRFRLCNRGSKIRDLVSRAEHRLTMLQGMAGGDAKAQSQFETENSTLLSRRQAYYDHNALHKERRAASERDREASQPEKKPRLTGSLLPPTLYNYGLPRMRPQPTSLSMMIRKRTISRRERLQRQVELHELESHIDTESNFMTRLRQEQSASKSPLSLSEKSVIDQWNAKSRREWKEAINITKDMMDKSFRLENNRAKSVVSHKLLKTLKKIKRSKIAWRTQRNKEKREEQRRQPISKGE
ncbi:unnamed protein product [Sympodiomycopsis kandeliae]